MFTLLAKLVRCLNRKERNALADKLVSLAKGETPDVQPDEGGQSEQQTASNIVIVDNDQFRANMGGNFNQMSDFMQAALERGTFCGLIARDANGMKRMVVGQNEFVEYQGAYSLIIYLQGHGSSTTLISTFNISTIPASYVTQFRAKEEELKYNPITPSIA